MRKSKLWSPRTIATAIVLAVTTGGGSALGADDQTDPFADAEKLLQDGRVIEAREALNQLSDDVVYSEDEKRLLELRAAVERRLRFLGDVELSLQKAELALATGNLRLAETHSRAALRKDSASEQERSRAAKVLEGVAELRAELEPMVQATLDQSVADFEAERYAEAKAGLGSIVRIGPRLSQEQTATLNRYRDRLYELERERGSPFEIDYVPLTVMRGAPQEAAVAAVAAAAVAQDQPDDPLQQDAERFDAERIMSEANADYDAGRYRSAVEKFDVVLRRYAGFFTEDQLDQVRQRQRSARQRLGQPAGVLQDVVGDQGIMLQQVRAEFGNSVDQAKAALDRGDINSARNFAAQARFRWTDAFNSGVLSDEEFRQGITEVNDLVADIDSQEEAIRRRQIAAQESQLQRAEAEARAQQESERRARINESLDRMRSLQREHRYEEALEVAEQVLFLDPGNPAAELIQDVLKDLVIYRDYAGLRERQGYSFAEESLAMQEGMIIPDNLMDYPSDWPELSFRRGEVQSFVESDADRRTLAALDTKTIPAEFSNNRLDDVLSFFARVTNINVDVDWDSLERIGVHRDAPVSLSLQEVPARVVLDRVLEKTKGDPFSRADWAVNDGVLVVAAEEALRRNTFVVIYDIRDLLFQIPDFDDAPKLDLDHVLAQSQAASGPSQGGVMTDDEESEGDLGPSPDDLLDRILEIIQTNVDFEGWRDNGGSTGVVQELNGNLIITNTARNHRQIQGLLNQLREIRSVQISVETRFLTVQQEFFEQIAFDLDVVFNGQNNQFQSIQQQDLSNRTFGGLVQPFNPGPGVLRPSDIAQIPGGLNPVPPNINQPVNRNFTYNVFRPNVNQVPDPNLPPTAGPVPVFQNTYTIAPNNSTVVIPAPDGWSTIPVFQDSNNLTDALVQAAGSGFVNTILGAGLNPALAIAGTFLDDVQVDFLVEATQADQRNVTLSAPRLTFSNGRAANISVVNQVGFISDLTPVVGTASVAFDPTVGRINEGFSLAVRGVASADRRYVTLTVQTGISRLTDIDAQTITAVAGGTGGGGGVAVIPPATGIIEIPTIDVTQVNTGVTIPDKGTILLGGQRLTNEIEIETGVPVLSKLPIINRFFTNRAQIHDERTLLILMKPTIIIQSEREEEEFPGLLDQLRNPFR